MKLTIAILIILRILFDPPPRQESIWDDYDASVYADETSSSYDSDPLGPDLWGDDYGYDDEV